MATILDTVKNNEHVPLRCYNTAFTSDEIFNKFAKAKNILIEKTPDNIDIYDHIDYYITINNIKFSVDIKSAKKFLEHQYTNLLNEWIWVELKSVIGRSGWLYGKADYIVYIFPDQIWFINRKKLVNFIEQKITKEHVTDKKDAKYKIYSRQNRLDEITLVKLEDVKNELKPNIMIDIFTKI